MPDTKHPQETIKFEIQAYRRPKDRKTLRRTHVAFSGSPQRHPYDAEKIILIADPYSSHNVFYEFYKDDIAYVEELPSIVNVEGDTIMMVRTWIKKMSIGIRCSPFIVEDISAVTSNRQA
ncbi:MAG: inorganic pyrophosphatase Ppa [Deltaproteobacteria bacterium]|jgi:inorganic pyrophosphatase|nr:inorganic pyrophosphatase Ppa [Deltaproteobacteria bacterium]